MRISKSRTFNFIRIFMFTTIILVLPVILVYQNVKEIIVDELGKSAVNIASAVASFIEQDIEPFKELVMKDKYIKGNYDEVYYKKMLETFRDIKKKTGVTFIYAEKLISDKEIAFIFDGEEPTSKLFCPLGSIDDISDAEQNVFSEGVAISTYFVYDHIWREQISGFAPIIDKKNGEVVGLTAVNFSLAYISNIINGLKFIMLVSIFIMVLLMTVVVDRILHMRAKSLETDYLTGLYSKNYYEGELDFIIKDSQLKGKVFSLIMIDIDDFKEINDKRGHIIGDKVLKSVAKVMQHNMRSVDICSRYGGDEFIVILPETTKEHALLISERILYRISSLKFDNDGIDISMSLSIGIAEWKSNMTSEELIERADKAMYISKNTGKNKVTVYKDN